MKITTFQVDKALCGDCSMALRRFIEGVDGVAAVELTKQSILIKFDETEIRESTLHDIARNSIETLGYRIKD